MYKYILKRLLMMIPVLLGVMIAVFTITYFTPGDPARLLLGDGATKEAVEQVHEELGIDDPYIEQLGRYIGKIVFHFDFGTSYISKKPVTQEILQRFPTTLKLASYSVAISVIVAYSWVLSPPRGSIRFLTVWQRRLRLSASLCRPSGRA